MTHRKKLIEVALPLETINEVSVKEKSPRLGSPSTLHLWWARRPLAAVRAVIFSSLVDDPNDPEAPQTYVETCRNLPRGKNAAENDTPRQRLFDFIDTLVQWDSMTDIKVLNTAYHLIELSNNGKLPVAVDPFAGGGSIPLEAQRLGLEVIASDLNPVAVLINKALIEIPSRFSNLQPINPRDRRGTARGGSWKYAAGLAADVDYYGKSLRQKALERIGEFYPKGPNNETVIAWIWARTVKSPNPAVNKDVPLVSSFILCTKKGKRTWIEPQVNINTQEINFLIKRGNGKAPRGTMNRSGGQCLISNTPIPWDYIKSESRAGRMGSKLMAIVTEGERGRSYYAPSEYHEELAEKAKPNWKPNLSLSTHPQYMAPPRYGMITIADLFTSRQLLTLTTLSDLTGELRKQILGDAISAELNDDGIPLREGGSGASAYADAITTYLGLGIGRQANRLSTLCFWDPGGEKVQQVFSRQAFTMNWNFTEANPFSNSSGNFLGQLYYPIKVLERLKVLGKSGKSIQEDAVHTNFPENVFISTDPPYYDNVPYADLSDFFYVWLRHSLSDIFPELFGTLLVPKEQELVADHQRHGGRENANLFFENGLKKVFSNMRKSISRDFPLSVYYAFKQSENDKNSHSDNGSNVVSTGWETMLESLIQSGFTIVGTWPMRTEQTSNIKKYLNALASSIVLVCRPRNENAQILSRRDLVSNLRKELPNALKQMQSGNVPPVDFAQAAIGPGMEIYSRYKRVLEPNGEQLTVRTALQLINHELDLYLAEQEGYIDSDSRFAAAWFDQFGFKEGPFGQADVLARAKNTSVDGLASAGVLESGAGKVRLYHWSELEPGWVPTKDRRLNVWEATHHLIERLNTYGEEGAAQLLAKMPSDLAAEARQLAYRLYSICERKGWAEHARDYNALVVSWSTSQEQAREFRDQYQQGRLFE